MRLTFLLMSLCLILGGLAFPCHAAIHEGDSPVLATRTLEGADFNLSALRGKVVIVHFWATWCSSCREEMPLLDAFYTRHHADGVEMIAISVERPRARDKVLAAMKEFHFPASLANDANDNDFGLPSMLPVTCIIDQRGVVASVLTPDKAPLTQAMLEAKILPLLTAKPR